MVRVVGVGDNTVDIYTDLGLVFPGGNAVNVPVLAHRYGHPASYVGWLGDDRYGHLVLDALREEGIDTSRCRVVDGPNAHGEVSLVDGDRVFGAADHGVTTEIALDDDDLAFIRGHDLTHTSIYSHIERELPRLRAAAPKLSFDCSSDWSREYLTEVLPWTDLAFLSHAVAQPESVVELLHWARSLGPGLVVVTCGKEGAFAYDGGRVYRQEIVETRVVDTLGAGDAFAARLLVDHLGGAPLDAALAAAAASAAEACGYYGAFGHGVPIVPAVVAPTDDVPMRREVPDCKGAAPVHKGGSTR